MVKLDLSFVNQVLHDQKNIIEDIKNKRMMKEHFIQNNIIIIFCTLIYGAVLGCYVDGEQVLINSVKIPMLFLVTLYIALPIFYIIETILGAKIEISQMALILLTGYVIAAIIMLAFTPFMLFFILTAKEYYFTVFLTIGIMGLAGYFSLYYIYKSFRMFHDDNKWYPSFVVGSFVIAFVGTQLSWALRPYFHSADTFTRPTDGNFYVAMADAASNEPAIATSLICTFGFIAFIITVLMFMNSGSQRHTTKAAEIPLKPYQHYYPPPHPRYVPVHPQAPHINPPRQRARSQEPAQGEEATSEKRPAADVPPPTAAFLVSPLPSQTERTAERIEETE